MPTNQPKRCLRHLKTFELASPVMVTLHTPVERTSLSVDLLTVLHDVAINWVEHFYV